MTIDPDFALAMGVSIGSTLGALAVWLAWTHSFLPPSLGLIVAVAAAAPLVRPYLATWHAKPRSGASSDFDLRAKGQVQPVTA